MLDLPKSIVVDGVLTSPVSLDESQASLLEDDIPFPEYLLKAAEESLRRDGDRDVLVNADLGLRNLDNDNLSRQGLRLSDVAPKARHAAKAFHHLLGLQTRDIVQVSLPNTTEYYFPVLATWLCRGIASLVDPALNEHSCAQHMEDTNPKVVVCCNDNKDIIIRSLSSLHMLERTKIVIMDFDAKEDTDSNVYSFEALLKDSEKLPDIPPDVDKVNLTDVLALVWSSGTTGRPKAVRKTHRCICPTRETFLGAGNKTLMTTHFFHNSGIVIPLGNVMHRATTFFFPSASLTHDAPAKVLRAVDRFRVDMIGPGGSLVMELCNLDKVPEGLDLSSANIVFPIGTNVVGDTFGSLKRLFPNLVAVPNIYTLTEFGGFISLSSSTESLGYVPPGTTVKIMDQENGRRVCGVNEVGEILAKCSLITPGYHNRPEEDEKLFAEDGFMRTGDLGHYDEDGMLFFDGRGKELIKYKGRHIFPTEIEDVIAWMEEVKEVGVFGRMDRVELELATALVVRREGGGTRLTEEEVEEEVCKELEDFKRLRGGVRFVSELPKNAMGKLVRKRFQDVYDGSGLQSKGRA